MKTLMKDLSFIPSEKPLKGLWRLLHGYRLIYAFASLALGISTLSRTGASLWLRYFIDDVLPSSPTSFTLFTIGLGFVGLALLQGGFAFLSGSLSARTAENVARDVRNYIFDHLQRLAFTYHDRTPTGDLIQRSTSDVEALRRFFADQFIGAGRIILLFLVNFIAILALNVRLALLSVIAIPFIVVLSLFFFRRITKAYEAYQEQEAVLSTTLQENLSAVRVVKAFARQLFERDKFEKENWEKFKRGRTLLTMHSLYWPSSDILASIQMLAGLWIGALMAIDGEISIGTYVAYSGMIIWIIWPMRQLGRLIVQMSMGLVSFGRISEIIREPREVVTEGRLSAPTTPMGNLIFQDVGFSYPSGEQVLHDITFECSQGEVIGLLGPTGSGKTSLVNLLPRFYEYTQGSILLDGVELTEYAIGFLRGQIGIVEQEPFLFSRSIKENITLGLSNGASEEQIHSAANAAAIHDDILGFPEQYDTVIGERGVTLSGGQKQRVAIARTLLKDPSILILDDSTSSVDSMTEASIRRALERLMEGRTTFIIAHRVQSVRNADRIFVLDQGRIVQMGTHSELIAMEGIYQDINRMQTEIEDALQRELADA